MFRNPLETYEQSRKPTASDRQIEVKALYKAARSLEECQKDWHNPDRRLRLHEALTRNQKLWTLFQSELAQPHYGLPADLRRKLLLLSTFIDRRTLEVIAQPQPEKLTALININRHIALGLAQTPF